MINEESLIKIDEKLNNICNNKHIKTEGFASYPQYFSFLGSSCLLSFVPLFVLMFSYDQLFILDNKELFTSLSFFMGVSFLSVGFFIVTLYNYKNDFFNSNYVSLEDALKTFFAYFIFSTSLGALISLFGFFLLIAIDHFITLETVYVINSFIVTIAISIIVLFATAFKFSKKIMVKDKTKPVFSDPVYNKEFQKCRTKLNNEIDILSNEAFFMVNDINDYFLFKFIMEKENLSNLKDVSKKIEKELLEKSNFDDFDMLKKDFLLNNSSLKNSHQITTT